MKVLILSVTAGQGHHQSAKAVMEYLVANNVECVMLDTFEYINPILSESIARGYLISTKFTPAVYGKLYRLAEKKEKNDSTFSMSALISSILSRKLITYIQDYNPNVIVCTHIFAAQIVSHLQRKNMLNAKTIGIITDFTIHPFWEDTDLDYYITANELLNYQAQKKGIPEKKIKALGIPIHSKFAVKMNQSEARALLGIEDKLTVLVMSGSMGYGNVGKIVRKMDKLVDMDFQIMSVCGNNKRLKKHIDLLSSRKKIYNYGFVDNVDVMMDAADCIVTKPGGLTVSESLAKGLPMILMNPIPGQEDRNVDFLLNNGLAVKISSTFPIDEALYQILSCEWRRQQFKQCIERFGKPYATRDLCNFIRSIAEANK